MKYQPKFSRIQEILGILSRGRRVSIEELQERFSVSKRTIQRDLEYIRNKLGIEIDYDSFTGRYSLQRMVTGIPFTRIPFTEDELYALRSAVDFLKKRKIFPLTKDLENIIQKIQEYMKIFDYQSVFEMTDYVVPASFREEYIKIKKAIYERKYIEFEYYGSKEKRIIRRKVAPWFLIFSFGKWYLIGYCVKRDEMRTFDLKKIKDLTLTDEICTQTVSQNLDEFKKDMFGPWKGTKSQWVSIFYDREVAKYIKEKYFPQEHKKEEFQDGSMRLKIKVSSPEAVLFYLVLPYHYHAEVESPKSLKKKLIEYLKRTLNKYTKS